MSIDRATLRLLLDDAHAQGLTVEEYERRYGLQLGPAYAAARRVASHETPMSELPESRQRAIENAAPKDGVSMRRVG